MTGGQLRALTAAHARLDAAEAAARMGLVRTAVWADEEGFARALDGLGPRGGGDARADWLEGWDEEAAP